MAQAAKIYEAMAREVEDNNCYEEYFLRGSRTGISQREHNRIQRGIRQAAAL